MKPGFIGTGAITEAIVRGLAASNSPDLSMIVSPRNATVAARLAARFPGRVLVAESNQQVVDASGIVVIAVRPALVGDVLPALRFRPDHLVVSLAAAIPIGDIAKMVAPATRVFRAIPLPSAAERASPTAIMPPDPEVKRLFDRIGVAIETSDVDSFNAMSAVTGVLAGQLAAADIVVQWLARRGLGSARAERYVRQVLLGLAGTVARAPDAGFDALAREHMTKGGLNEQFLAHLTDRDLREIIWSGLDALSERIARG